MKKLCKTNNSHWKMYHFINRKTLSVFLCIFFAFRKILKQSIGHIYLMRMKMCFEESRKT